MNDPSGGNLAALMSGGAPDGVSGAANDSAMQVQQILQEAMDKIGALMKGAAAGGVPGAEPGEGAVPGLPGGADDEKAAEDAAAQAELQKYFKKPAGPAM